MFTAAVFTRARKMGNKPNVLKEMDTHSTKYNKQRKRTNDCFRQPHSHAVTESMLYKFIWMKFKGRQN